MPLPARSEREARVNLASPTGRSRMQRPGVVGHRLKSAVEEVDGIRVETRADTFVHAATMLSLEELVAVGDWPVSTKRRDPLTVHDLTDAAALRRSARAPSGSPSARTRARGR